MTPQATPQSPLDEPENAERRQQNDVVGETPPPNNTPNNAETNPLADVSIFDRMRQAQPLAPGDFLGQNFRIVRHLGRGGMGDTFLAEELENGEPVWEVVCKIVPPEIQNLERAILAVRRTFSRVHRLHHTNICPVRGLKFDDTYGWFLVMGYANGGTLTHYLARHPEWAAKRGIPLAETLKILSPVAKALDYIHEEGVFHRDIKPDNVMFSVNKQTRRMTVQLIDFGLSAQLQQTSLHAGTIQATSISGTPHFMAPEQWLGQQQCRQTDQYALGVMMYRLLSRRLPFRAANIQSLMAQVLTVEAAAIADQPAHINAALQRALSKEPEQRFPRCVDFIRALQTAPMVAAEPELEDIFYAAMTGPPTNAGGSPIATDVSREGGSSPDGGSMTMLPHMTQISVSAMPVAVLRNEKVRRNTQSGDISLSEWFRRWIHTILAVMSAAILMLFGILMLLLLASAKPRSGTDSNPKLVTVLPVAPAPAHVHPTSEQFGYEIGANVVTITRLIDTKTAGVLVIPATI